MARLHITRIAERTPTLAAMLVAFLLTGCIGTGAPTPPAIIGSGPQSIVDGQPPIDDGYAQTMPEMQRDGQPADYQDQASNDQGLPPASSMQRQPAATRETTSYNAPASHTVLTFEPMVGAPKSVARELSKSLGMRVAQQALPVVARNDSKVTHRIKGYFSARESGSDCEISYVWDIFDEKGKRVNRITGSQRTAMVSSDPWDAVKGAVLDKVAVDTAAKLKTWHASI